MIKTGLRQLLLILFVLVTSVVHLPAAPVAESGRSGPPMVAGEPWPASGHVIHGHGHIHSSADHSHVAPVVVAVESALLKQGPCFGLCSAQRSEYPDIALGLRRPPRF